MLPPAAAPAAAPQMLPPPMLPPAAALAQAALPQVLAHFGGKLPQSVTEERLVGRIKRYTDMPNGGGYGFIDCEETKLRFSRDVYIHKNQMHGMKIGDMVSFTVVRNNKGEPQARNVMMADDALLLRPEAASMAAGSLPAAGPAVAGAAAVAAPAAVHAPPTG